MKMMNIRRSSNANSFDTATQAGYKYKVELPPGFKCILEDLAREVMLKNPSDINEFSADHFKRKLGERARDVGPFGFEEYYNADESCQPCTEGSLANEEIQSSRKSRPTGIRRSTQMAEPFRRQSTKVEEKQTSDAHPSDKSFQKAPVSQLRKSNAYPNLANGDNAFSDQPALGFSQGSKHTGRQSALRPLADTSQRKKSLPRDRQSRTSSQASATKDEDTVSCADSLPRRFDGSLVSDLEKGKKKSKSATARQSVVDDVKVTRRSMLVADGPSGPVPRWSIVGKEPKEKPIECPQMPEPCRYVKPRSCRKDRPKDDVMDHQLNEREHHSKKSNIQPVQISGQRTARQSDPRSDTAWPNTTLSKTYDRLPSDEQQRKGSDIRKISNLSSGNFEQPPRESVTAERKKPSRSSTGQFGSAIKSQRISSSNQPVEYGFQNTAAANLVLSPNTQKRNTAGNTDRTSRKSKGCRMPVDVETPNIPPLPSPPPTLTCRAAIDAAQPSAEDEVPLGQNTTRKKSSLIYSGPGAASRNKPEAGQGDSITKESAVSLKSKSDKRTKKSSKRGKEIESYNDRYGGLHDSEQDLQEKPKVKKSSRFSAFFRRKKKKESIPEEEEETEDAKEGSPMKRDDRHRKSSGNRRSTLRSGVDPGPAAPSQPRQYSTLRPTSKTFSLLSRDRTDTPEDWVTSISTNTDSTPRTTVVTVTEKKITRYGSNASDTPDRDLESDEDHGKRSGEKKSMKNKETKKKSK